MLGHRGDFDGLVAGIQCGAEGEEGSNAPGYFGDVADFFGVPGRFDLTRCTCNAMAARNTLQSCPLPGGA